MEAVFLQAAIYLGTMPLGYLLKRAGIFRLEDKQVLGNLIVYLTLPALLVSSFSGVQVDFWFLVSFLLGLGCNAAMVALAFLSSSGKSDAMRALYTINGAGFNLGNITIPFLREFFPGGIPYLCMFDTGDSFFTLGTTYAIASTQLGRKSGPVFKHILRSLLTSVPFDVYVIMTLLSLFQLSLPPAILQAADFLGQGNGCLAMLMVGISLELHLERSAVKDVLTLLALRYAAGAVFALSIYFLLPAPLVMRQILAVAVFSSAPNVCVVYSNRLGVDASVASALNPLSTLLSLPLMAAILSALLG